MVAWMPPGWSPRKWRSFGELRYTVMYQAETVNVEYGVALHSMLNWKNCHLSHAFPHDEQYRDFLVGVLTEWTNLYHTTEKLLFEPEGNSYIEVFSLESKSHEKHTLNSEHEPKDEKPNRDLDWNRQSGKSSLHSPVGNEPALVWQWSNRAPTKLSLPEAVFLLIWSALPQFKLMSLLEEKENFGLPVGKRWRDCLTRHVALHPKPNTVFLRLSIYG